MDKAREKFEEIKKRVEVNPYSWKISRIPPKIKKEIMEFAEEEFCSDFGMAIAHIWNFFKGAMPKGDEPVLAALEDLNSRIEKLETQPEPKSDRENIIDRIRKRKESLNAREKRKNG